MEREIKLGRNNIRKLLNLFQRNTFILEKKTSYFKNISPKNLLRTHEKLVWDPCLSRVGEDSRYVIAVMQLRRLGALYQGPGTTARTALVTHQFNLDIILFAERECKSFHLLSSWKMFGK